jgi:hypothetical protein
MKPADGMCAAEKNAFQKGAFGPPKTWQLSRKCTPSPARHQWGNTFMLTVYFEDETGTPRRSQTAHQREARRIAANIAKLPRLLGKLRNRRQSCRSD